MLVDLERSTEILGGQSRGCKAGEESVEDRKTLDLPAVRLKDPKTQLHRGRYQES